VTGENHMKAIFFDIMKY